ncbi:MAG TPA: 3-oxoacyl-[acyl-carrier-protein] reductase [Desulfatirhabdiaceae bacterium]|nr:3-oxoacyl-[acyl-carrier-protein] reductase [Desulfatirhabdiaceae bacterium]
MNKTDKQTIVVTGGSRGIGRAICLAFADSHSTVYFNYSSNHDAANATRDLIVNAGGSASGISADIASESAVTAFFQQILLETGRIDVLVNNAGITRDNLLVRMKESDWDEVMRVNLKGVFHCTKAVAKPMIKQHSGRIINITSVVGAMGNAGQSNYAAAKAGIIGFTKSMARELASRNITVNAVAPGYIETDMTHSLTEKVKESMIQQIPLGRFGAPGDVAQTVRFLASENAAYITGQVIHVSGGMYI